MAWKWRVRILQLLQVRQIGRVYGSKFKYAWALKHDDITK